ncbi:hypothetical protein [Bdellovibrio sp. HCB2-146]|uniref:hypothetical protein n=1 Tax=Bdellovibrio sp. HCB2-146 TaxID=3394362 RepID=UPI0039BD5A88
MKQNIGRSVWTALQKTLQRASLIVSLLALALVAFADSTPKIHLKESTSNHMQFLLSKGGQK